MQNTELLKRNQKNIAKSKKVEVELFLFNVYFELHNFSPIKYLINQIQVFFHP